MPPSPKPANCGDCFFGEVFTEANSIKRMVRCRFGFATATTIPQQGGIQVRFLRPCWDADEWCYQFKPRPVEVPSIKQ